MSPEEQLALYEQDVNAEKNIRDAVTDAYKGLKPELELIRTFENRQFPAFYEAMHGYGAGTSATDLSPTTILQNALQNVGRQSTAAQVARDVFTTRQASMEDLIKTGVNQWKTGYGMADNAYNRWWQQKQHEDQMALAREQMRRSGGTGGRTVNWPDMPTNTGPTEEQIIAALKLRNQDWNAGADAAWNKSRGTKQYTTASNPSGYFTPAPTAKPASTVSPALNSYIDKFRGL
jgi:hypothetical protein